MARKPLFMHLAVAKESREIPLQEIDRTPVTTQFKQKFSPNLNYFMKLSIVFSIFALPLIALCIMIMYSPDTLGSIIGVSANDFNFAGNLGIGFPGLTGNPLEGYLAQLDIYVLFFELIIPAFTILGLGLAGAMNCTKKSLWNEKEDLVRNFFGGIKKYWYKCMFATTIMGTMVFTCGWVTLWLVRLSMTGQVLPWHYVVTVFTYILFVPILFASYQMVPLSVTYDSLKLHQIIKNSFILAFENILQSFIFTILIAIPIILMALTQMFGIIIYLLMALLGFAFYIMAGNLLGVYGFNIYLNPLYSAMAKTEVLSKKEQKKKQKQNKSKKSKTEHIEKAPKVKKAKTENVYANPKKKKKNDNK